jgi:hypothetical protein
MRQLAVEDVKVRAADAASRDVNEDLSRPGGWKRKLGGPKRAPGCI